ncbi:MAG: hypothetical protein NT069_01100 [Planctomycetota bacterium]|nr:hypothetical protein [Planctomycetota bacterium]
MRISTALKQRVFLALAAVYVVVSLGWLGVNLLGISPGGKFAYCFTWDMFPHFQTESVRRVAIGQTRSGEFVLLHPSDRQQFREGVAGDLTRVDLDRGGWYFRTIVERVRQETQSERRSDPLVKIYLFEQFWPVKFNLSDRDYERWMGAPKPFERIGLPAMTDRRLTLENEATGPASVSRSIADPPSGVPRATWRLRLEYGVDESTEVDESTDAETPR